VRKRQKRSTGWLGYSRVQGRASPNDVRVVRGFRAGNENVKPLASGTEYGKVLFQVMKLLGCLFAGLFAVTSGLKAQSYSIDWHKVAGGGGTSTGGVYSVSGTIGQPDAGVLSGGNYSLVGGFWGIIAAVQTPGAPVLTITRTATNSVVVSWPYPSTGFSLQQNPDLKTTSWTPPPQTVNTNASINWIVINPPLGNLYYRLKSN
jgi:hypothetical protein